MEELLSHSPFSLIHLKLLFPFCFPPEWCLEAFFMGACGTAQFSFQLVECSENALSSGAAVFLREIKLMLIKIFKS